MELATRPSLTTVRNNDSERTTTVTGGAPDGDVPLGLFPPQFIGPRVAGGRQGDNDRAHENFGARRMG